MPQAAVRMAGALLALVAEAALVVLCAGMLLELRQRASSAAAPRP